MPKADDDGHFEFRVLHGPCCRVLIGWSLPMADASALVGAWVRDGYRYSSTRLQHKWGVAFVALKDPAAEAEADAWYARHTGAEIPDPPLDSP
jgi:hypothetical protein